MRTRTARLAALAGAAALLGGETPCMVGATLTASPPGTLELGETAAVTISSAGSLAQFAPGSALEIAISPEIEGGAALNPPTLARGADGSATFDVFTGTAAPQAYVVTVTEAGSGLRGSVSLAFEPETTIALDAPDPAQLAPGTTTTVAFSGTASGAKAFLGAPTVAAPEGSGVSVANVGYELPPSPGGFLLLADVTVPGGAAAGPLPLLVDTNGALPNARATAFLQVGSAGDPFADEVVSVAYGPGAGFGQSKLPGVVLGAPRGGGSAQGSLDVLTLGDGGTITLAFTDNAVLDGPGTDLLVFENTFFVGGNPANRNLEVARVAVSADGLDWREFPSSANPALPLGDPDRYSGLAGVNCVDPLGQPAPEGRPPCGDGSGALSGIGGDAFDLADVGLSAAKYVRITDVDGDPEDPGDAFAGGFDLDAVAALHSGPPL